jgi:hypothetical protein
MRPAMTSISGIVEKSSKPERGLGRVLHSSRGRERRAEIAARAGAAGIGVWVALSVFCGTMWAEDAVGSVLILGLLLLPVSGWALHWASLRPVVAIEVHELGIVRRDRSFSVTLPWTQISEVFESTREHVDMLGKELRGSFTFVAYDGRQIVVDHGVPEWRAVGKAASAMAQDAMAVAYELGLVARRPLRFGELVVDGYGVHTTEGDFPWSAVSFVRFDHRRGKKAAWCVHVGAWSVSSRIPSDRIANARALVMVLDRLGKLDVPASAVLDDLSNVVEAA